MAVDGAHDDAVSFERMEALFEVSLDMLCVASTDGYFKRVNPAFTRALGYTETELLARPFIELVHPDDRESTLAEFERLTRGVPTLHFENRCRCADGSYRRLAWVAAPKGELLYASARDVTRAHDQHARSHFLAGIVESSHDAIVARSLEGKILSWNAAATRTFGYSEAEALGMSVFDLTPPERRGEVLALVERMRSGEGVENFETVRLAKGGRPVQVALTFSPIRDERGEVVGASVIARDVTARRSLEHRLQVAERLTSLGTMAAGVAHEVNNPLATVLTSLDLVLEGGTATGKDLELLRDARAAADKVRAIVRSLGRMSRLEEGRVTVLDLRSVLDLAATLALNEVRHRATLKKDYCAVPPVRADEPRLAHVFANLLLNAAQAMPEGHAHENEIRIVTRGQGGEAIVEIRDTGGGIAPEHLSRIFDPFFTTKPIGVGSGLGLPMCHATITAAGGTIHVESEVGRGTTVRIALPAAAVPDPPQPKVTEPATPRRGRVLVLDDDEMVGNSVRRTLARDHDVTVCTRGSDALAHIDAGEQFDVVLCDMMMPEMSGPEVFAELSRRAPALAPRVVFMSGGAFTPEAREFLDGVVNEQLGKPFELDALRAVVRRLVARSDASPAPDLAENASE